PVGVVAAEGRHSRVRVVEVLGVAPQRAGVIQRRPRAAEAVLHGQVVRPGPAAQGVDALADPQVGGVVHGVLVQAFAGQEGVGGAVGDAGDGRARVQVEDAVGGVVGVDEVRPRAAVAQVAVHAEVVGDAAGGEGGDGRRRQRVAGAEVDLDDLGAD